MPSTSDFKRSHVGRVNYSRIDYVFVVVAHDATNDLFYVVKLSDDYVEERVIPGDFVMAIEDWSYRWIT